MGQARRRIKARSKNQLVDAVIDSESDLILALAWRRMKFRRMFLLGLLAGVALLAVVHVLVCP